MDNQLTPKQMRQTLYPESVPYRTGKLKVSGLHELYFEECGSPSGKPVVLLHGGPGGGINPVMRRYHDPRSYRIVLFDQRGCGRSTPHASLEENTTWDLVDDIERQRASEAAPRGLWSAWSMKSMILYVYLSALCFHSPNISRA